MNDTQTRLAYEEWCRKNRKRKSDGGWELWKAAYEEGWRSKLPEFDALPDEKRAFVRSLLESLRDA